MPENKITISLEVDDKGTVKIKQFGDETEKATKKGEAGLESLKSEWVATTAKITAFAAAAYGAARVINSFVSEAAEAESIERRLQFALETTGYSWAAAKDHVDRYAQSIQETTRFSDEQARQALTDMMMYTQDFSRAQMGAKLAMDMSVRTGQDLGSTSRLIGMAMTGNVEMLGRYIPQLRNLEDILGKDASMAEKAAYAMKILQDKFGGTAQADLDTYVGKLAQFKNSWGDFKEKIGNEVLPVLKDLLDYLTKITKEFTKEPPPQVTENWFNIGGWGIGRKKAITDLWVTFGGASLTEQQKFDKGMKKDIFPAKEYPMMKVAPDMWEYFKKAPGFIEIINNGVVQEVISVEDLNNRLKNEVQLKEQLMDLAPKLDRWEFEAGYGPPAGYVRDVGGGLISMADAVERNRVLEEFKNIQREIVDSWEFEGKEPLGQISARKGAQEAFEKTKEMDKFWADTATSMGQNFMSGFFNIFTSGIKNAGDAFKKFGMNLLNSFTNVVQQLISNWLVFGSIMGSSGYTSGQKFGGLLGLLNIFKAQEGFSGMVNRPTGFIAGESGREFVNIVPESKMRGAGGGTTINNIYYVTAMDQQSVDQALRRSSGCVVKIVKTNIDRNGPLRGR